MPGLRASIEVAKTLPKLVDPKPSVKNSGTAPDCPPGQTKLDSIQSRSNSRKFDQIEVDRNRPSMAEAWPRSAQSGRNCLKLIESGSSILAEAGPNSVDIVHEVGKATPNLELALSLPRPVRWHRYNFGLLGQTWPKPPPKLVAGGPSNATRPPRLCATSRVDPGSFGVKFGSFRGRLATDSESS